MHTPKSMTLQPASSTSISAAATTHLQEQTLGILPPPSPTYSPNTFLPSPWDIGPSCHPAPTSPSRCLATITKRCGKILSLAVSEDGLVYAGTESKSIRVWRDPGFFEISQLQSGSGTVEALVLSYEDGLVFTAHSDRKVRVWQTNPVHVRKGTLPSRSVKDRLIETWLKHNPKKAFVKSSSSSSSSSSPQSNFTASRVKHSGVITSLAYNLAAKLLYSASLDSTIKVWSIGDMKCVETVQAHDGSVNALAVGPDTLLFSGSDDGTVKIWKRCCTGRCFHGLLFYLHTQSSPVKALALSREGSGRNWLLEMEDDYVLYAGCSDGYVRYWKKGGSPGHMVYLGYLRGHSHAVLCLAAVEKMVLSGSADASIRVWRRSGDGLASHQCTAILCGHIGPVKAVAAKVEDEQACLVYSGSLDGSVKQWRVRRQGRFTGNGGGAEGDDDGCKREDYFEISGTS